MKHKRMKRIGALLLALCLLVGMLPTSALAANAPEEAEPETAALEAETQAEDTEELPSWWNDVTESCHKYFWNYNMSIVNQSGTGTASQIRNYYGKDLSGNGKPAYLNYNDMATGMGNFEWELNFDAVNDKKFYFRWIGVKERAKFKNSEIIYIPFSADFTVPAYTEYEILWEFGIKTTRNSKGTAGFYTEVFSWGEEFPAASSLKFMTGDTNQASPNALKLSNGARVYADADGQNGAVKVRVKYSNGTAQPKTFTPKFGMLSGVGESDSLSDAYHHTLHASTTVTATCQERPFNEPIARVDGVDYQDIGKAVEAFNLSSRESSTFELLKNYGLFESERENPPVYTFNHSGVVEMNGKYWEVGGLAVKSGNSVQFRNGKFTIVGDASTYISNDGGNVTLDNMTVAPTYGTDSTTTGIYSTGGEVKLKNASSVVGGKYGIQALSGTVTVTDGSQVRVYASESAGSAVRATGNAAVQISGSQLRSFSGAAVDMAGGGTLRLSGDTLLISSKSAPQIDLGGSAKLVGDASMDKPSEPYRLRVEFDAAAGFRAFTQGWDSIKAQGTTVDDYFVNQIVSNGAESKIIPGGYFAEKDGEAVIEHNAVTLEANGGKLQGTEDEAVTLYTDMAGKLSEYPSAVWAGRSFAGWYSADGKRCGSSTVFSERSTTIHARWGEAGIPVTLDYNRESGVTEDRRRAILGKPYNQIFGEEGDHPLPGADQMVRNGYTFDGWYTQPEGGEQVTDSTVVTNPEAHSIYAHWRPNEYTMTVGNLNGGALPDGETFQDSYILKFGETYPELSTPVKPGYRLASWRNQYGTRINAGDTVDKTYNQTLTALWELKLPTYNVTLNPGEGGRIANGYGSTYEVNGGEPYGSIPSALRDGYIFDGWWTQEEGGEQITSASTAPIIEDESEAGTLYAHWTRKNYTVTFYDGYKVVDTVIVPAGDKAPKPADPVKTGYSFNGWRTQRYGQGDAWDFDDPVNGSLVLYTYWTSHMLTVTLNVNGGRLPHSASDRIGYDKRTDKTYGDLPIPTPSDPTQEFIGWYTEMENGDLVTAETSLTGVDHTLYAHWGPRHYALKFDANGGECTVDSVKAGEENVLGDLPVPTRSGYDFSGWFTAKSGGTQIKKGDALSADVTVYARWTRPQYTVKFDLAGGTMADTAKSVTLGGAFGELPTPSRTGYRFGGWWYTPAEGDPVYAASDTAVPEVEGTEITLTAHWSAQSYTVMLDANGGGVDPSHIRVLHGGTYGTLPTPTRTGYTFGGWYTAADGAGTKIEDGSTFDQGGNQTLYARWTADTYTVNFIPGGNGSVDPASKTVTYGGTYGDLPIPTKAGETFVGWYTAQSGGKQVTMNTPVECVESRTIDLYAHWRTTHAHPVGEGGTDVDFVGVTSLDSISGTLTKDAAYFLEGDGSFSTASTIRFNSYNATPYTITICLNGKTITGPADAPVFEVQNGATLKICDCQGGGKITLAPGSGTADGIIHENGDAVHLYGGTITGNNGGCGVYVNSGFHMYGGAITDNKTTGNGGGVHVRSGAFSMYGGVISGNTASGSGGGVGKADGGAGSITISGGAITGNKAAKGGGVFSDNNKMVMTGGSISGNTATERYGGAYSERGIAMTGGEITGNKAPQYGGFGVIPSQYVGNEHYGGAALELGGTAKIIGNTTNDGAASNLFLYAETKDGSTPVEKLSVTIDSTTPPIAGAQIGITAETTPYHLFPVDISKVGSGDYSAYFISDDPSCSVQNSGADAAQVLQLVKYAPRHEHPFCGPDGCGLDAHSTHTSETYQPLESGTMAKLATPNNLPSGNYYLTEDITLSGTLTIPENATVNLCLNGHTLSEPNNRAIKVGSGSTLRLCDCVGGGGIANSSSGVLNSGAFELYSGSISNNRSNGVYNASSGTFHMYSGSISGNTTSSYGGGVYNSGAFDLYGGSISGNTAANGGGIYNEGTFEMHGGIISGNNAATKGGGIHNSTGGTIVTDGGEITGNSAADGGGICVYSGTATIKDGRISGNTASGSGGGVYHRGTGLTVSGNTVITGNTIKDTGAASNVYLGGNLSTSSSRLSQNTRFTIGEGGLAQTASIGVSGELLSISGYENMRNFAGSAEAGAYIDRFFCDDGENSIWANGDYLWFGTNPPHSHAAAPGGDAQTFEELTSDMTWGALTGGAYFLSADLSTNPITIRSGQVTICLNGHTLKTKEYNQPAITVEAGATLNLCDCQGGGKVMKKDSEGQTSSPSAVKVIGVFHLYGGSVTGNLNAYTYSKFSPTNHHGGGVRVENGGQFNMHGGSITGNSAKNGSGGGVYVASGGTFTMDGGEISGNTSGGTRTGDGGGGICVASGGTASLLGGVVSGNTATGTSLGGGVYTGGDLTVGGSAVVQDNVKGTAPDTVVSNIYLPQDKTVAVSAETPLNGARLGITTQTAPTDSAPVDIITGAAGTGLKGCFSSDNEQFDFKESDSALQLIPAGSGGGGGNDPSITPPDPDDIPTSFTVIFAYPGSDGQTETVILETDDNGTLAGKTLPAPTREGYKFDGWYLDDDTPVTTNTKFEASAAVTAKWTICDHTHVETEETKAATCSEMGETQYTCSDCGAVWTVTVDLAEHQWGPWTKQDDNKHTRTCASGKETHTEEHVWAEDAAQSVKPSCKGEGKTVYVCSGCGASKTVILPATAHSYPETWEHGENGHWQVCTSCHVPSAPQVHLFTESVTAQPGCDTAGELTLACSACGYETTEAIPALEHSFQNEWEKDANFHWHVCARDNTHTSEKLAHSWDSGTVLTPATTTSMGTTQYTCIECGQTKTEQDIPMVEPVTYTLTYTPGENASGENVTESGKTAGESVTLPTCAYTRTGYTFAGWRCGESTYQAGDPFTVLPGDVTFTAQWTLALPFTLQPGDTVVLEDGITISRSGDGATVTVGKSQVDQEALPEDTQPQEKTPETTITVPAGGTVTLMNDPVSMPGLDESGNETTVQSDRLAIEIPGNSKVQAGENNPEITIPENETAKVALDGGVYDLPTGTTVTQGDSTVTVGSQGGSVSLGGDVTFGGGDGQVTVQNGAEDPISVTVPKDGGVSVTPDENARRGGGKVTDSSGSHVANATVELRQGDTVYGSATTDSEGNYTFLGVYPGVYDLVVSEGGRTLTKRVEFTGEAPIDDAALTNHASTLSIAEGTNLPVVVGGLDAEAETQQASITMTVEQKTEDQAEGASSIRALAGEKAVLDCLDVKVQKGGSSLSETQEVLEIILPFEFSNVEGGVKVYRVHQGSAEELTENESKDEGTFFTDPAASVIRIYASKFSTYALGYAEPNTGLEVSVAPGETKTAENGITVESREDESDHSVTVTITDPDSGETTTIDLHWEGDQTVLMNKETGEVTVPENARVPITDQPGRKITLPEGGIVSPSGEITANPVDMNGTTVTVTEPEGRALTADKDGSITIPGGTTATLEDDYRTTTVIVPEGGTAQVDMSGDMTVPENTVVKTGDDGAQITLPEGGTVENDGRAASGKVQVGDITITVIDPQDGEVTVDPSGNVTIPAGVTVIVTDDRGKETTVTVPDEGNTGSVKPDGSMTLPENGAVTVEDEEGNSAIITMPEDGGEVKPGEDGGLVVPDGSKVQAGENRPEITVGPGNPATVKPDGSVTVPENGKVTIDNNGNGTTEITVPVAGGGTITPNDNGTVVVPENSTVTYTDGAGETTTETVTGGVGTVKPDGTVTPGDGSLEDGERIELPDGSTITRAGSTITLTKDDVITVVTLPSGTGRVTVYEPTGEITLPDGSRVKTTVDATEVPEAVVGGAGNTVKPGGKIVLKRDENASVTVGENPATIFTWSGEEGGAPSSVTPTSDGKLYAYDCVVQTGTGPKLIVSGEVDPQDGSVEVLHQGRVTVAVGGNQKVEILNNDPDSSGPIIVTPGQNGETILPDRAIVRLDGGSNNTVKVPSGGTLSKDGETVKVESGKSAIVEMRYGTTATITAPVGSSFTVDENAAVTVTGADAAIVYQTSDGELLGTYPAQAGAAYYTVLFLEETLDYTCRAAQAVKSGEKAAKPDEPAKDAVELHRDQHYQFVEWAKDGAAYQFNDTVTGSLELFAKWNKVEHSSTAAQWEKNETHHWKICTQGGGCTERVEEAAHDANGTGGACSVCGYKQGSTPIDPDPETVTVTPENPVTLPGNSGTVEKDGTSGSVTIKDGTGSTTTTIDPNGGDVTVNTTTGEVTVPGGSTVKPGDSSKPEITVGGQGGTVDPDTGEIIITAGGSVTIEDENGKKTTVTIPDGGTVTPNTDGTVTVSGESTVKKPDGTTETVPAGGKVDPTDYKPTPITGSGGTSTYTPAVEQPEHGQVTVSPTNPEAGGRVTITVTPEEGYEPSVVTVTDNNGKPVEVTKNEDGTYTFIQPEGKVTISATMRLGCPKDETCPLHAFADVSMTAWYHDGVHYCLENALMAGLGNGKFGPTNVLTRGMLAQILYNKAGRPEITGQSPFEDVAENRYYAKAIAWAAENHIVAGYDNGKFGPDDPITREQLAAILWRYAGSPESAGSLDSFTDGGRTSNYAVSALQWAVEQKIVSGKGNGILDPRGKATRAEVAAMLMRYCQIVQK